MNLNIEISSFLEEHGFSCSHQSVGGLEVITTRLPNDNDSVRIIIPVDISAKNIDAAIAQQNELKEAITVISDKYGHYPLIITQDR